MNGVNAGISTGTLQAIAAGAILVALFAFGLIYNSLVAWIHERREFPNSILVVIGVIVTTLGAALLETVVNWNVLLLNLICFAASGSAMIIGDLWRMSADTERALTRYQTKVQYYQQRSRLLAEKENGNEAEPSSAQVE